MRITRLGLYGGPTTDRGTIAAKTASGLPAFGTRIEDFDTWRPGYAGASVLVVRADTNVHAPIFADPLLTIPLENPVVLLTLTDENGDTAGKWPTHVYTYVPFYLTIDDTAPTGVERPPIYEATGLDLGAGIAASTRGQRLRTINDILDDMIFAEAFGSLAAANGAEANTAVLQAAIGAAAAQSGGSVILPGGRIVFTEVTLPEGVVLQGQGRGVTILTSTFGAPAVTFGGDGAGLAGLTLDGILLATGSIGVQGTGVVAPVLDDVLIQRFDRGMVYRGVTGADWSKLTISNCVIGADIRGDTDPTNTAAGGVVRGVRWRGGGVNLCTTAGLKLTFFDALVESIVLSGVEITDNLGDALLLNGARNVVVTDGSLIRSADSQHALRIQDDSNAALVAENTTDHITFEGGIFDGGTLTFNGTCASVSFVRSDFRGVNFDLTVPTETIVLQDCIEDADTTETGDTTKLMRSYVSDDLTVTGTTTDNVPTVAWSDTLEPGQVGFYQAEVVAQQQDGVKWGVFWIAAGAQRPGAGLTFNLQTANFTAGATLEGATSHATARIAAVTQAAGSGTLTLADISGTFVSGEVLNDGSGGAAASSGTITTSAASLAGVSTAMRTAALSGSTAYAVAFDVSGAMVRLMVTGTVAENVQFTARIRRLDT